MRFASRYSAVIVCAGLVLAQGCANKDQKRMERGVEFARQKLAAVNTEQMSSETFKGILDSGGTEISYLTASAAPDADLPSFVLDEPSGPYCVVVKYDKAGVSYIVEGYGEDLSAPSVTEMIKMNTPKVIKSPYSINDLCAAAMAGKADKVQEMLDMNTDPNGFSSEGCTPLMYAAAIGNEEVIKALLSADADPKAKAHNSQGWTPLLYAVHGGSAEVVKMLIAKGSDPTALDRRGNSPLMLASMKGFANLVDPLVQGGCGVDLQEMNRGNTALLLACTKGNDEVAGKLIENKANVNMGDRSGFTPLMACCERGNVKGAQLLLESGAAVDAQALGGVAPGATALMMAAAKGQDEAVRLLISKGAKLDVKDKRGSTALRYAEYNGMSRTAQILKSAARGGKKEAAAAVAAESKSDADEESMVGKSRSAADKAFGRPIGTVKKSGMTVIFYKAAEVVLDKDDHITSVKMR